MQLGAKLFPFYWWDTSIDESAKPPLITDIEEFHAIKSDDAFRKEFEDRMHGYGLHDEKIAEYVGAFGSTAVVIKDMQLIELYAKPISLALEHISV